MKRGRQKGTWFPIPDDPDEARFLLTVLTPIQYRVLNSKADGEKQVEYHENDDGVTQRFEYYDRNEELYNELLYKTCILNWEGIQNDDGTEFPYSPENCIELMKDDPVLAQFVTDSLRELNRVVRDRQKATTKNLPTS